MALSKFVRLQIWISLAFITGLTLFFVISWLMGVEWGDDTAALLGGATSSFSSPEWEVLIVDLNRRDELWEKFDGASDSDRKGFYLAWVRVISQVSKEQAQHVAAEVLRKRWPARRPPSGEEKDQILKGLEATLKKSRDEVWRVADFLARELKDREKLPTEDLARLERFVSRLISLLHHHPLQHCLQGDSFGDCSQALKKENTDEARDTLWKFSQSQEGRPRRKIILILLSEGGDRRPKFAISALLGSEKSEDWGTAATLIRNYRLKKYLPDLEAIEAKVQNEQVRREIALTLRQLR